MQILMNMNSMNIPAYMNSIEILIYTVAMVNVVALLSVESLRSWGIIKALDPSNLSRLLRCNTLRSWTY